MCRIVQTHGLQSCRYAANWYPIAEHWVDFGLLELKDMARTNNILERWVHTFKYDFCAGKVAPTLCALITTIFERVLPRLINDRALKQAGMA